MLTTIRSAKSFVFPMLTLGVMSFFVLMSAGRSPAQDRPSATPARTAAKHLAWEFETLKSVEVRTRFDIVPAKVNPQQPPAYDAVEDHYIETAIGQRKCDSRYLKSDKVVNRLTHYSDGTKCADVNYSKDDLEHHELVVIKRQYFMEDRGERMERPEPLRLLYVGREPLAKALPKATYLGEDQVLNRACDRFLFAQVRWEIPQDHVYYLDKATSIPLKVESYKDQATRDAKKPLWIWTAESLDKVQEHFVPLKSRMTAYGEESEPTYTWNYHVQSIEFDKDFPPSMFWPTIPPGVTVMDTISNKRYQAPGADAGSPATKSISAKTTQLIEATPPSDWSAVFSSALFVLGAAAFVVGGLLWWRRH
jgi:hypothetical protein